MANVDAPFGLRPIRHLSGAPYNGATSIYHIPASDSTAVYVGGLVKLTGAGDANGIPVVTGNVSSGDTIVGVVVSVDPITADSTMHRVASTARYVHVALAQDVVFEVQEDSDGGALTAGAVGGTATLTGFTAGSAITGRSAIEIDSSGLSETSDTDDDVQILRLSQKVGNAIGANAVWEVRLNNYAYVDAAVGV